MVLGVFLKVIVDHSSSDLFLAGDSRRGHRRVCVVEQPQIDLSYQVWVQPITTPDPTDGGIGVDDQQVNLGAESEVGPGSDKSIPT